MGHSVLITGGSGMVGSQADFGIKLSHADLDIMDVSSIEGMFLKYSPSVVLHCAALVDMLTCARKPLLAQQINVLGTRNIAEVCRKYRARLVYLSTCTVFGGSKDSPYNEEDHPCPRNVYGATKFEGEVIARQVLPDALIIRTGWLFGGGLGRDKKFVGTAFYKLSRGENVRATNDRYGSPTAISDLLETIKYLIEHRERGTVHVVNGGGPVNYYEIARVVKEYLHATGRVDPAPAIEMDHPEIQRGVMEALSSHRVNLRPWSQALEEYVKGLLISDADQKDGLSYRVAP